MKKETLWIIASLLMSITGICTAALQADINHDGRVDLADLAILAQEWLQENRSNGMRLGENHAIGWFDSQDGWNLDEELNDIAIANGHTIFTLTEGGGVSMSRSLSGLTIGKTYRFSFDVTDYEGALSESSASGWFCQQSIQIDSIGSYYADIVYDGTGNLGFGCNGFDADSEMSFSNLALREILPSISSNDNLSEAWGW